MSFIGDQKWPDEMETIRTNLLQSKMLDDEDTSNQGNEYNVIDSLLAALLRVYSRLLHRSDDAL